MKNEQFQGFLPIVFEILPKFRDFLNFDDCIGKITSKSIRLQPVLIKKLRFEDDEKQIFSSEKMRNPDNYIYDDAYSFIVEHF